MRDKVTRKDDGYGRYRVSPKMAIFIFVVIILVAAALVWYFWDRATLPERMADKGCTVAEYNQYGEPRAWDCPIP
jgi:hypothetical protein